MASKKPNANGQNEKRMPRGIVLEIGILCCSNWKIAFRLQQVCRLWYTMCNHNRFWFFLCASQFPEQTLRYMKVNMKTEEHDLSIIKNN